MASEDRVIASDKLKFVTEEGFSMEGPKNVMIFPAGTEIAFEIFHALKDSKFVNLYGGTSVEDHSEFVYERLIRGIPYITDENFLAAFNRALLEHEIEYVYPAHDAICMYMSEHRDKIKAQVICSNFDTVDICRSKEKTYQFFQGADFVPKTYRSEKDVRNYPVFIKPKTGEGSRGARLVKNERELQFFIQKNPDVVICEYLPGEEYTVDCFTDGNRNLKVVKLRNRLRTRAGISVRSSSLPQDPVITDIANQINDKLEFRGAWFFQMKKDLHGTYKLLEISPRIPGTMGLSRNAGINFPLLTLFVFWGMDVKIIDNAYQITVDRAFYSAYRMDFDYQHIYVDFDDTLIVRGNINIVLISFLYQALNKKKEIYLLSRHRADIRRSLEKHRIHAALFKEIIILKEHEEKKDFIKYSDAIFIDDSFAERYAVSKSRNIPVFDVDMVESLIDWRR